MRSPLFAWTLALSAAAVAASACSSSVKDTAATSTSTGAGGGATGGAGGASPTTATQASSSSSSGVVDAGPDVDNGMVSTMYPAPHAAAPQVITGGGPTLASPKLVPVFFAGDDMNFTSKLTDFLTSVGSTQYWAATTSEYGVGPATATAPVMLTETAPATIDDTTIQTWLAGKLNGDDPAWPAADDNTIYVLHYPSGTSISLQGGMGGTEYSCQSFGGYHDSITLDGNHANQNAAYAVIPRCSTFGTLHGLDAVTAAESHELIEAATDPYPQDNPAYAEPDDAHLYWLFALGGGEVGDMCAQFPGAFTKFMTPSYEVQRTWSNQAAKAGHDPCVPEVPGEVYFNTAPLLKDNIDIMGLTMKGVKIPVGGTKTVELDLFSEGDTGGPWFVDVKDYAELMGGAPTMSFSLDDNSGQNGQKLHLTITVNKSTPYGAGLFVVTSSLGNTQNWWIGLVGN